ncbi:DUF2802 domain-containing protein [Gilvimarinus xylanilyticus]|uniref:DUF2802 domain-containing protein n=1 Tax=Gilvimarinus xylanilyticus TaxID=2944139 RepID=A0A9X2KVT0_9GAMM|nr:DUF2802 domain-containing protein [Gilvimarinus xylanilyticus]MCP8898350.1 DUF2802 domain-containing protein [Gilvimarinus xylanilyticus]
MGAEWMVYLLWLAPVALLVSVVVALTQGVKIKALSKKLEALEVEAAKRGKELNTLRSGAVGMGQRIVAMERQDKPGDPGAADGANARPYSEASHLLSLGLDRDEVASRCGLSRAEASLLDALRKKPES